MRSWLLLLFCTGTLIEREMYQRKFSTSINSLPDCCAIV
jgi:hypothetical protein